jgi:hypothetical protein
MSAHAPAGSANRTIGRLEAVCTSDTSTGDWSISNHCAPTVCIHVPMLEANWAIHSARNNGESRSGAHAGTGRSATAVPPPPAAMAHILYHPRGPRTPHPSGAGSGRGFGDRLG